MDLRMTSLLIGKTVILSCFLKYPSMTDPSTTVPTPFTLKWLSTGQEPHVPSPGAFASALAMAMSSSLSLMGSSSLYS